jgi:hypothetical protein
LEKIERLQSDAAAQAYLPYGHEAVLVQSIDIGEATGLLAAR